jgi:hypothetical protein
MLPEFSVITSDPGNQKQETFQKLHVTGQYYYSFSCVQFFVVAEMRSISDQQIRDLPYSNAQNFAMRLEAK